MAQVKKESVRLEILESAFQSFSERGYHQTTLQGIAANAGVSVGSVYSYFDSKLHLVYEIFEPWQDARLDELARTVREIDDPRERLRAILLGFWRDIPTQNIGLANSLMEALSSADPKVGKPSPLLKKTEARLRAMIGTCVADAGVRRPNLDALPNLLIMAYDGFVINRRLNDLENLEGLVDMVTDFILGPDAKQAGQGADLGRTTKD